MWQTLFTLTNGIAFVAWIVLIFAPRRPLVLTLILHAGVGLLCLAYTAMLVALLAGWADPGRVDPASSPSLLDYSVQGIRRLFQSDGVVVLGWTHYLALDLFTGLWIGRDGDGKGVSRFLQAPVLLLTFLVGPLGLLVWLCVREPAARRKTNVGG